jgi:Right handed beta helix region
MRRRMSAISAAVLLGLLGSAVVAPPAAARVSRTIVVPPGAYRESVLVTTSHLTITHAGFSGVFLVGVDGYRLTGTRYVDNPVCGPFPVCSHDGLIDGNQVVGGDSKGGPSTDTGIYLGDDDQVTVRGNSVTNYVIGVVVENTINATVQDNLFKGNTAGIYAAVLANHPRPFTDHVVIDHNQVVNNNLPNPVPADSGEEIGGVPTGVGIVNCGADHVVVRDNWVLGNDSLGVIVLQNFVAGTDARIEPNPDFGQVRGNVILGNGHRPDPVRAVTPGADLVYDGTGTGTCFADNVFATEFPTGITEQFPCGNSA